MPPSPRSFHLRTGHKGDGPATLALLKQAVLIGAAKFYSIEQRQAWAEAPNPETWEQALLSGHCTIAVDSKDRMLGFFTIGQDGHLDFAYVAPDMMGQGVSAALYQATEDWANSQGIQQLSSQASHLARRFLERRGWQVEARQHVIRNSVAIENFRMVKHI